MADLDSIFQSDLDENKKLAKRLFGKLLINMRKNNHLRLYSLMSDVGDCDFSEDTLTLVFDSKSSFEMINNKGDIECIENELCSVKENTKIVFKCEEKKKFDKYQFKEYLKKEFGKILTFK